MKPTGILYLVSTPIGNLEDMSMRAIRILKEVQVVAAEDTRRTGLLLHHFGIENRLESYHDFNKETKGAVLIRRLVSGESIAVVSDAGTPGISDPAFNLVRSAIQNAIPVVPIPGPTAAIAALTVSGLPTDRFVFEGFLPVKKGRKSRLENLSAETRSVVLYESPHRLLRTLNDLREKLGDRRMAVCREMTKKFEDVRRGSLSEMIAHFSKNPVKGEFVLVIQGCSNKDKP
jgi:16S rRNA (cytidine1402-2'-O)-methyltransferase